MARFLVLNDYVDAVRHVSAGDIIDDAYQPVATLPGLALIPYVPSAHDAIIAAYKSQRAIGTQKSLALLAMIIAQGAEFEATEKVVYRPGGVAGGQVLTEWADVIAAAEHAPLGLEVIFDDANQNPIILPANPAGGRWMVHHDMIWSGHHLGTKTIVHLADGFGMAQADGEVGVEFVTHDVELHSLATAGGSNMVPFEPTVADVLVLQYGSTAQSDGDLPWFRGPAGLQSIIALYLAPEILAGATEGVESQVGGTVIYYVLTAGTVAPATCTGAGDFVAYVGVVNPNVHVTAAEQPNVTGSVTMILATESHFCGFTPAVAANWPLGVPVNDGAAADDLALRAMPIYMAEPAAAINADFDGGDIVDAITEVAPSAARKFDPRVAPPGIPGTAGVAGAAGYAFTLWKSNAAAFGVTIDVTTGGVDGWTTDSGLETDHLIVGSDAAAPGQWLVRVDRANKRINVLPVS